MFTGYREFDAYARSLRRTVWARQFEQATRSMSAAACDLTIAELLTGEAWPRTMPVAGPRKATEPSTAQ